MNNVYCFTSIDWPAASCLVLATCCPTQSSDRKIHSWCAPQRRPMETQILQKNIAEIRMPGIWLCYDQPMQCLAQEFEHVWRIPTDVYQEFGGWKSAEGVLQSSIMPTKIRFLFKMLEHKSRKVCCQKVLTVYGSQWHSYLWLSKKGSKRVSFNCAF